MKILYYDCFAGISGDMNLAAMIDLGVEPDYLRMELSKLGLDDEFELVVSSDARSGIHGTRVDVQLAGQAHDHGHHHGGHHHGHAHGDDHLHDEAHGVHRPHRSYADIREIITGSALSEAVKQTSLRIFHRVAEAEARVHGKSVEDVHFHEVGATDSIVDIVGAAICFHRLDVDAVWGSSVELGSGFVRCAHGVMPVPAPATVEILQNIPTRRGGTDIEATTPTGAAILAAVVDKFIDSPSMTVSKTGYGIGHMEGRLPNLARVYLATIESDDATQGRARLLQCNIDDMTGEQLGDVMELLMEKGAMDVHFTPIVMKKNRPATQLSLLCGAEDEACFRELVFRHTTTLGIKIFPLNKAVLERRYRQVETPYGSVSLKEALLEGEVVHAKPEYEDCRAIARREGISLAEVQALVARCDTE